MAANLALQGMYHGAGRIPDAVFERAPIVGPRYFQSKDRDRDGKGGNNQSGPDSDSESSADPSGRSRRRRRRERRRTDSQRLDRGYDSDQGPAAVPYFPPPPTVPIGEDPSTSQDRRNTFVPRPYNPADYGANPGTRDAYFAGHPQERQPTPFEAQSNFPPPPPLPAAQQSQQPLQQHVCLTLDYFYANLMLL
jgi:hypothetical protein